MEGVGKKLEAKIDQKTRESEEVLRKLGLGRPGRDEVVVEGEQVCRLVLWMEDGKCVIS